MLNGKPYKGLTVIDASQGFAAPYCAGLLALYGANVIKIEPPEGDWARNIGKNIAGQTALHIVGNRGKRSISLDLKQPAARQIVHSLAKDCDVFLESFRPGVAARLDISYDKIRTLSPDVLYVSVSGFGQDGPYANRPATDSILQAFTGFMTLNKRPDGTPQRVGMLAVDTAAALHAFQALQAALYARKSGDGGRWLQFDLMRTTASFLAQKIAEAQMEAGQDQILHPPAGAYETSNGWVVFSIVKEEHFARLCRAVGKTELLNDPRFVSAEVRRKNGEQLRTMFANLMKTRTTDDWIERLHANEVLSNPINTVADWLEDAHVKATETVGLVAQPDSGSVEVPIIPGTVFDPELLAPAIGGHGREILKEFGFTDAELGEFVAAGVVNRVKL
jgi:crotonobetainyl-CoA:carnitine CoA-transferase CaiB-like acyl-CoA transferase